MRLHQDLLRFMNVWVQFVLMVARCCNRVLAPRDCAAQVWVGLMGGASYVNTFYLLLNHKDVPAKDKCVRLRACARVPRRSRPRRSLHVRF